MGAYPKTLSLEENREAKGKAKERQENLFLYKRQPLSFF
jgi:hypothetical protein